MKIEREIWITAFVLLGLIFAMYGFEYTGMAVKQAHPTYTNVRVTHYYVPHEKDFTWWYNPENKADEGSSYYCSIVESKRGFYEEVKCQGSGVGTDGKVYTHDSIKTTKQESKYKDKIQTATGAEAKAKRTIAVAPDMIPYRSKVYIRFKDCEDMKCCERWEGEYIAEDTGSAMVKDWEDKKPHIDLFTGIGKRSLQDASCLPDYADLYVESIPLVDKNRESVKALISRHDIKEESIGIYAVRPGFEASVNYDFSDYDIIRKGIEALREACVESGAQDIKGCLEEETEKIASSTGLDWSPQSCDTGKKALFYSFVKSYKECYFSPDDDCYCESEIHFDSSLDGTYKIYLEDDGVYTATLPPYSYELEGKRKYFDNLGVSYDMKKEKESIEIEFTNSGIAKHKFNDYIAPKKDKFTFYKKDGTVSLAVVDSSSNILPPKESCGVKQDHFQFCVTNNDRKYPKIEEGKFMMAPVVYKFAIWFEDRVPPPKISDLSVEDKLISEKSLKLTWSKSQAKDAAYYAVYLYEDAFDNITEAENVLNVTSEAVGDLVFGIEAEHKIDVDIFVEEDEKEYHLAVTAVDNNGNELEEVVSAAGVSLDDLGPMKPSVVYEDKKYKITYPDSNQDGTEIKEDALTVFVREGFGMQDECNVANIIEVSEKQIGIIKEEDILEYLQEQPGCYGFTAKDSKGNIRKLTEDMENAEDIIALEIIQ